MISRWLPQLAAPTVVDPTFEHPPGQADVPVAAAGCARMVTAEMVKPGAIVIDVGINVLPDGSIVGDVDFASVREVARAITPVPGGVGPLTNVMLLKQCVQAWQRAGEKKGLKSAA